MTLPRLRLLQKVGVVVRVVEMQVENVEVDVLEGCGVGEVVMVVGMT